MLHFFQYCFLNDIALPLRSSRFNINSYAKEHFYFYN